MKEKKESGLKISDRSTEVICNLLGEMLDRASEAKWQKPWMGGERLNVMNLKHKKPYNGFNAFLLEWACIARGWKTPFFLTLDQVRQMGLRVNKVTDEEGNEKSEDYTPVFKWLPRYVNYKTGERVTEEDLKNMTEEEREDVVTRFSLRVFAEYNIDQTNLKELFPKQYDKYVALAKGMVDGHKHDANVSDATLDYILTTEGAWRCPIKHSDEDGAYYVPSKDYIHLPERKQFFKANDYYSTALHEMAHSTKKVPTMSRDYGKKHWGDEGYATEELVAELTSAIVCHDIGLEKTIDEQHIAYVNSWRKAIKDKDILRVIIDDLMKCVRYELNHYNKVSAYLAKKSAKERIAA